MKNPMTMFVGSVTNREKVFVEVLESLKRERKTEPGRWHYTVNGEPTCDIERIAQAIADGEKVDCWLTQPIDFITFTLTKDDHEDEETSQA